MDLEGRQNGSITSSSLSEFADLRLSLLYARRFPTIASLSSNTQPTMVADDLYLDCHLPGIEKIFFLEHDSS